MKVQLIFIILTILVKNFLIAQKPVPPHQTRNYMSSKISMNQETGNPIIGDQYVFSKPILKIYVDKEDSSKVFIIIEDDFLRHQIVHFDLILGKSLCAIKYNPKNELLSLNENNIFFLDFNGLSKYNKLTGEISFSLPINGYFASAEADFIIGYSKYKKYFEDKLLVHSFKDGLLKSSFIIKEDSGIEKYYVFGDSSVMISASGIHYLNLKTNLQWSYKEKTSYTENGYSFPFKIDGLLLGSSIGYYQYPTGSNKIFGISSNIYKKENRIYKSSLEKISCLDLNGNVIWSNPLNKKLSSTSIIFNKNNVIYNLNFGFAFSGSNAVNQGDPYIASYDSNNGKKIGFHQLGKGRTRVTDFHNDNEFIYILLDKTFDKFELGNLKKSTSINNKNYQFGELHYFERNILYQEKENKFYPYNKDSTHIYIKSKTSQLVEFDKNLKFLSIFKYSDLWLQVSKIGDYEILTNDKSIKIIKGKDLISSFEDVSQYKITESSIILYNDKDKTLKNIDLHKGLNIKGHHLKVE